MSCVVVVAPLVIGGWPVITAAVTAAVSSMGFSVVQSGMEATNTNIRVNQEKTKQRVEIEVDESEVLQDAIATNQIVVEREGMRAIFSRDARGALKLCMEGESHSKADLKRMGEELINRVTQQFVYHRVVTELKQRGMSIVDEQVTADRTVKLRVRNIG